jgi:murein DD-endopeptidase MepM/ murein hydrolase activator NlpD
MDGASDSITTRIATTSGNYPIERLRVAPAFGRPPDSATAARIARESKRAVDVATQAHATPRLWQEPFAVPREARITSGFGGGREFNGTITSRHMGTDFAGATGSPVRAANRGVVRIVDAFFYGGNVVYLDHGAGTDQRVPPPVGAARRCR